MTSFIILGATGDLTKRKLIPAIYHLVKHKKIDKFAIVGVARSKLTAKQLLDGAKPFIKDFKPAIFKKLLDATYYIPFNFSDPHGYAILHARLNAIETKHKLPGNRLFYLATLPQHFDKVTYHIAQSGLAKGKGWARVVYEKPFGYDLKSAKEMNKCIARAFSEKHIYRIDHYLGKEIVGNIALVRFTNRVFEPLWNNKHIDSIQFIIANKY